MHSPLSEGEVQQLTEDSKIPLNKIKRMNVDAQTAMTTRMVVSAIGGDVKSAEWVCKYGGLTPVIKSEVTMNVPTFVDDIPEEKEELSEE